MKLDTLDDPDDQSKRLSAKDRLRRLIDLLSWALRNFSIRSSSFAQPLLEVLIDLCVTLSHEFDQEIRSEPKKNPSIIIDVQSSNPMDNMNSSIRINHNSRMHYEPGLSDFFGDIALAAVEIIRSLKKSVLPQYHVVDHEQEKLRRHQQLQEIISASRRYTHKEAASLKRPAKTSLQKRNQYFVYKRKALKKKKID